MDERRRRDLRESLQRQLGEETRTLGARDRVLWLTHRLELYVGRFLGLADASNAPTSSLLGHDLFGAIGIGTGVLDTELRTANPPQPLIASWQQFCDALEDIRNTSDAARLPELRTALAHWQSTVLACQW